MHKAIIDLVELVHHYPRENVRTEVEPSDIELVRQHYSRLMYQVPVILHDCTDLGHMD